MSNHIDIPQLLLRRLQGIASIEENKQIEVWADQVSENRDTLIRLESERMLREDLNSLFSLVDAEEGGTRLRRMEDHIRHAVVEGRPVKRFTRWLPYVAAVVLMVTIGVFVGKKKQQGVVTADVVAPGGNRATLTLADGRTLTLDEMQSGIILADDHIMYADGSKLLDRKEMQDGDHITQYAILTTPRGGTYQIGLPDGTQVWLNAASSLRYPTDFSRDERVVEMVGEGYFVVAKDNHRPFKVVSQGQVVEVLGTEFNVSSYPDEHETKTTLVQGSVKVGFEVSQIHHEHKPFTLMPGQQGISGATSIRIEEVDVNQYTAWKDGFFYFNGDSPQEAFAQLSRWYDIELVYRDNVPTVQFYGKLERSKSLGTLLRILEKAGLAFQVVQKGRALQLVIGTE